MDGSRRLWGKWKRKGACALAEERSSVKKGRMNSVHEHNKKFPIIHHKSIKKTVDPKLR